MKRLNLVSEDDTKQLEEAAKELLHMLTNHGIKIFDPDARTLKNVEIVSLNGSSIQLTVEEEIGDE